MIQYTILILIEITLLSLLIVYIRNNSKKQSNINSDYTKMIAELDSLVQRKCYTAYKRALQPYVDKALKNKPLINDDVVKNITLSITKEILAEMSEAYIAKLKAIYKEEILEDIILELVYNTITEMSLSINKTSLKKMTFFRGFNTINKNDFD